MIGAPLAPKERSRLYPSSDSDTLAEIDARSEPSRNDPFEEAIDDALSSHRCRGAQMSTSSTRPGLAPTTGATALAATYTRDDVIHEGSFGVGSPGVEED